MDSGQLLQVLSATCHHQPSCLPCRTIFVFNKQQFNYIQERDHPKRPAFYILLFILTDGGDIFKCRLGGQKYIQKKKRHLVWTNRQCTTSWGVNLQCTTCHTLTVCVDPHYLPLEVSQGALSFEIAAGECPLLYGSRDHTDS